MKRIEKEIKEVENEINNYIHDIADIKVPTDKEFNKHKQIVSAKVISSNYYMGVTISTDIVYDVVFKYVVDNIIYESRMQTTNNYIVGDNINIYYYKKDPKYIREINDYNNSDNLYSITIKLLLFIILLVIISILFVIFYY